MPNLRAPVITQTAQLQSAIRQTLMVDASSPLDSPSSSSLDSGAQVFAANCAGCHVNGGNIIRRGKTLYMRALRRNHMDTVEAIAHIVTYGKRPMSAYGDKLTPQEIQDVSAYVLKRAEDNWR